MCKIGAQKVVMTEASSNVVGGVLMNAQEDLGMVAFTSRQLKPAEVK